MLAVGCVASAANPPTFRRDVAPIIYAKCAPCHHPGEAAPFSLLTYADVQKRSAQIASATRRGYMPPWLPEAGYGDFLDDRRLTASEIAIIANWVSAGAPRKVQHDAFPPPPEVPGGWQLGTPDLVLDAKSPIELPASGRDIYWNVIFTPNVAKRHWVRAIEIKPGQPRVVHHANLYSRSIRGAGSAHSCRNRRRGKGFFPGMDLIVGRSPFDPDGNFLFWKPGGAPHVEPDGFAWRLDPGNELVLNIHLQPSGKREEVRPSIGLYFTDKPQTRFPLLVQLENDQALDIPAGVHDFAIADDFTLPLDADVLAIYPHAHYLGKLLEAYATLPDGSKKWLVRIPAWDPNWQAVFYYREPVFLPKDSVIHMRYHYDNSPANPRNPNHPPKRVRSGNQATDEMGHLWLQITARVEQATIGASCRKR